MEDRIRHQHASIVLQAISLAACLFCCLPGTARGDTPAPGQGDAMSTPGQTGPDPLEPTGVDLAHEAISRSVNDAANWFDSFFGDERYVAEEARSRVRLTPSVFVEEGESAETRLRFSARLSLPRASKRLRLVIADTSDGDESVLDRPTFTDDGIRDNDTTLGLQYMLREMDRLNISISAGLKRGDDNEVDVVAGPRYRRTWAFDNWQLRFTERIRLHSDEGWESLTRFDYERLLRDDLFFRTTTELLWNEDDFDQDGLQLTLTPTLTQRLKSRAGIDYQWINVFKSRPDSRLDSTTLRVRYRQRIWRKWLFYEFNPQLAFRDEDDFDATPGLELRLEASFGGKIK